MRSNYIDAEDGVLYETLEEAVNTSCPYCSTPLEWDLKASYDTHLEETVISGTAYSCGYEFTIKRKGPDYEYYEMGICKIK